MDLKNKTSFARRLELSEQQFGLEKELEDDDDTPLPDEVPETIPIEIENRDVVFEEVTETSDDEFEFKNPAPFVRTYRRSTRKPANTASAQSKEKIVNEPKEKSSGFRSSIRRSIRKLMAPHSAKESKPASGMDEPTGSVFTTLRQSFRRKLPATSKTSLIDDDIDSHHDVSILMDVDRQVFKQTPIGKRSDEALNSLGRKKSLRSSFRNTTKDVRRHVMKSVFKKNVEDYCLD